MNTQDVVITVCIKTAESIMFEGKARSISSINETGPFDILPFHENFISLIHKHILIVKESGEHIELPIKSRGILRVGSNNATILLGVEVIDTQK